MKTVPLQISWCKTAILVKRSPKSYCVKILRYSIDLGLTKELCTLCTVNIDIYYSHEDCPTAKRCFQSFCGAKQQF